MDAKVDDSGDDRKVNENSQKMPPQNFRASQPKRGVLEVGGKAEEDANERINNVGNQGRNNFGDSPAQDKANGESDYSLFTDKVEESTHVDIIPANM